MATVKVNGVDRSTGYRPSELEQINVRMVAFDGEVGQGTAPVPDPDGTQSPYTGESFQVLVGATKVIDGFVGPLQRERGESATGDRLLNTYTIGDENAVLHGFAAYKWKRPSESTRTRFLAMLSDFVPWVTNTTWVTTDVVETMDAKTYTTETLFDELMEEIADLTANTGFVENHRAHLHPPTNGIIGGIAFSDVAFDYVNTFPLYTPRRHKDGMELRNDVRVVVPGGVSRQTDPDAIARYDVGGLKHQALVVLGEGSLGVAAAKARTILASSKKERITYEFDAGPFTAAQLESIPVGCLVSITSAVLGLTASTQRIAAITLTYRKGDTFMAHIELGYPIRRRFKPPRIATPALVDSIYTGGEGAIEPGTYFDFFERTTPPVLVGSTWYGGGVSSPSDSGHTYDSPGVAQGGLTVADGEAKLGKAYAAQEASFVANVDAVSAFTNPNFRLEVDWRWRLWDSPEFAGDIEGVATGGETHDFTFVLWLLPQSGTYDLICSIRNDGHVILTSGFVTASMEIGAIAMDNALHTTVWEVVPGKARVSIGAHTLEIASSAPNGVARKLLFRKYTPSNAMDAGGDIIGVARAEQFAVGSAEPPIAGQLVQGEVLGTGDGSTTLFTTDFPYRLGSLTIRVNGIIVNDSISSQNPLTGDVSLAFAPGPGSEITADYLAV